MSQEKKRNSVDNKTDRLYEHLRLRYGGVNAGANGYRFEQYFLKEQSWVLSEISDDNNVIVDLACGSGLMIKPVKANNRTVLGIDYNELACKDARANGIEIIRSDVFAIPLADSSVDRAINCQFLNQQTSYKAEQLLDETFRVLKPGGRLILVWRNDRAFIHKLAVFLYRYVDRLTGRPEFPYYDNYIDDIAGYCEVLGFSVISKSLAFPVFNMKYRELGSICAKTFGASCYLVVEKQNKDS